MMKKTLIAAALAASATGALAQSVVLYGIADTSVRYGSNMDASNRPAGASTLSVASGVNNTSRFGIRGTEDLGGGYGSLFQLESGLNVDTGATARTDKFFDRLAFAGLRTPVGTFTLGRHATILADAISPVDPLGMRFAGMNPNINVAALSNTAYGGASFGKAYGPSATNDNYYRLDNTLKYTGQFSGVTARAIYSMGEVAGNNSALSAKGLGLAYEGGALNVSGAYMNFKDSAGLDLNAYTLGAAYRFGAATVKANYGSNKAEASAVNRTTQKIASLGLGYDLSQTTTLTLAHYDVSRQRTGQVDDGFRRTFLFLEYALSKRTKTYVEADITKWKANSQGSTSGVLNSSNNFGISVGVMHSF